jgi:bacterioferritin-associated ferredoxin
MDLDDPVCLCFHVTRRKIIRFIKVEKPVRASQLSECFGAGTGCGWCRDYLARLMQEQADSSLDAMDLQQYQDARAAYRQQKKEQAGE